MTTLAIRSPSSAQKGFICHAMLNEGERLFQSTAGIYIYIYMKVDKGVGESGKACEESCKAPCKNTSKPPFLEKGFFLEKDYCSFENSLLGYSRSPFQKESPGGQC